MTVYCGVDFHARQQTICYCDSAGGEIRLAELDHERDYVRGFYSALAGDVVVGVEASGYSTWFIELVERLGQRVLVGDAAGQARFVASLSASLSSTTGGRRRRAGPWARSASG